MDAVVHRIEALPGDGRFTVTFTRADGSEQTAVVQLRESRAEVAAASLPSGWTPESEAFEAVVEALRALARSRGLSAASTASLRDTDGGWDVSLGNVLLAASGVPRCIAHGDLLGDGAGRWVCPDCGAQALFGGG